MLPFLLYVYNYAEVYAVVLTWIVVPLGFWACYLFFSRHFGMFGAPEPERVAKEKAVHATNR
jgi:hypothetical protein